MGTCAPRHCFFSPATLSTFVDILFLLAMVWVLYEVAQVMRERYYSWWWAIPAAFAAPAILILQLKLRYVRRMCDQQWRIDVMYNARVLLIPLYGALANTIMISVWLMLSPLYVVEIAHTTTGDPEPSTITLSHYSAAMRSLLIRPSSILLFIIYVISLICALVMSARHRRVLLYFIVKAMEAGIEVGENNTSLLETRDYAQDYVNDDTPTDYQTPATLQSFRSAGRPTQAHSAPGKRSGEQFGSLYDVPLSPKRETLRDTQSVVERNYGHDEMQTAEMFIVDPRPGYQPPAQVATTEKVPPPPNYHTKKVPRELAQAAAEQQRKMTLRRFDDVRANASGDEGDDAGSHHSTRELLLGNGSNSPRGGSRQGSPRGDRDAEQSEGRLDSPRTQDKARGSGSRRNSRTIKKNEDL